MEHNIRFVGLDVHADTITIAVANTGEAGVRSIGTIANRPECLRKQLKKLGPPSSLRVCYEAGVCGYEVYRLLTRWRVHCDVIAPTLVPQKSGDRVKTDRRDATKLALLYRAGSLTPVWVPDEAHEALRDLVRAREAAKKDQLRARHRLQKLLLRYGLRPEKKMRAWTQPYMAWAKTLKLEPAPLAAALLDYITEVDHVDARVKRLEIAIDQAINESPPEIRAVVQGLESLRGIARLSAATIVAEVGMLSRFRRAKQLMGYTGAVSREYSSGKKTRRGAITKTGNAHLRRILVESAWSYRFKPNVSPALRKRQQGASEEVKEIAMKAQHHLHKKYVRLSARGKVHQQVVTAVARELAGFVWAVGIQVEKELQKNVAA